MERAVDGVEGPTGSIPPFTFRPLKMSGYWTFSIELWEKISVTKTVCVRGSQIFRSDIKWRNSSVNLEVKSRVMESVRIRNTKAYVRSIRFVTLFAANFIDDRIMITFPPVTNPKHKFLKNAPTQESDVFSFGLILYELLLGEPGFPLDLTPRQLMMRIVRDKDRPIIPE
jgi:hypothetical protein